MMTHVNQKKIPAIILLIDFSKAFGSINHKHIQNILELYSFGPSILNWVNIFFTNRDACALTKSNFSERILLKQGVPQGDIISPYIFVLAL